MDPRLFFALGVRVGRGRRPRGRMVAHAGGRRPAREVIREAERIGFGNRAAGDERRRVARGPQW